MGQRTRRRRGAIGMQSPSGKAGVESNMSEKNSTLYGTDMTSGKLFPIMFRFTVPLLLANVIQQMYNLADMMIVGYQIGNAGTVGVSTGGVLISFLTGIAGAVGSAAQVCSAQLWGAGKKEKAGLVGTNLLNAVLLASLFIGVICILITSPFVTAMNCPASASLQAERYMRIVSCGLPFVFGYNVVSGIMRGMGESKKPLLFVSLAALTNVIMDGILVVVFPLEATGSAIATVISQAMSFGASILYINRSGMQEFFHIRQTYFLDFVFDLLFYLEIF